MYSATDISTFISMSKQEKLRDMTKGKEKHPKIVTIGSFSGWYDK